MSKSWFYRIFSSFFLGLTLTLAAGGVAQAQVGVDQSPLTSQRSLPPNLVFMIDDSGSMAWSVMPDVCYLNGVQCSTAYGGYYNVESANNDALIDSANNGLYYNPTVTYKPPLKTDGSSYPNANGLTQAWVDGFAGGTQVDLTTYDGSYESYFCYGGLCTGGSDVAFNTTQRYLVKGLWYSYYDYFGVFQYSTGPAAGPYAVAYVASSSCHGISHCVTENDTSGIAAPVGVAAGQNIANWFAYYHTRILAVKSGLLTATQSIQDPFRVGFGSINGSDDNQLPSAQYSLNNITIAQATPFGDGSVGTQRYAFGKWVAGLSAGGGTPLRDSLATVGEYYRTAQPWETTTEDEAGPTGTLLGCRQAYTVLTTDGFWNGPNPGVGNTDKTSGPTIQGPNGQSYTYNPGQGPYGDSQSNTLADVAMKYWKTDLRPDMPNEVPTSNEDPAFWQHMVTFTMGLGFEPVGIKPAGTTIASIFQWALGGAAIPGFSWPTPIPNDISTTADLAHAAVDGHGGYYSALDPESFVSGIQDAIKRAGERVGTGASLAANSTQLKTGTVAYQANYYTAKWKGDLKAFAVDSTTGQLATNPTWTASGSLPTAAARNIYTYNPTASTSKQWVTFKDPSLLSVAEQQALGATTADQQIMINYLRGDPSQEQRNGGPYRNRDTPLGDIVDSQPVYVGAPDPNQYYNQTFTGSDTYSSWAQNLANRLGLIWIAGNDGMLHAFRADTGAEMFAYLPAAVLTQNLKALADPAYGQSTQPHQFFNDGELTVADAYFNHNWHTVLVGTTGRGLAKAVYALDITDPSNIQFLWERSAGDGQTNSNYIGQMVGKPVITQTANGSWSVLLGNGFNSQQNQAALLDFDLQTGALSVHTTTTQLNNGLAMPVVWQDSTHQSVGQTAYAGDLLGQVWAFTLNTGTTSNTETPTSTGQLLFTARNSQGQIQPITAGMLAGKDPTTQNLWLFFGTGQYLTTNDLSDTQVQSWYGLIVQSSQAKLVSNLIQGRSSLAQRSIVTEDPGSTVPPLRSPTRSITLSSQASSLTGKSGWFMDLVSPVNGPEGERMVTPNQFQGNLLLGVTRIPVNTDPCNPSGKGWIMAINPFTGTNPDSNFFDVNGDGVINSQDGTTQNGNPVPSAGVGFNSLPNNPIFVGGSMLVSFDNGSTGSIHTTNTTGSLQRVSWQELTNF